MSDITITFGRVGQWIGSWAWGTPHHVPSEPPMYWAFRGEQKPHGQDLYHYGDTPWEAVFSALARERRPLRLEGAF